MAVLEFLVILGARALIKHLSESGNSHSTAQAPKVAAPRKLITFVGAANAGKSSTLNALLRVDAFRVDAVHGSTTELAERDYESGYRVCDTPGFMDSTDYSSHVWDAIQSSELVVYTTTGQLYRPEQQIIERISLRQQEWDRDSCTPDRRKLALFLNKQDVRVATMSSGTREREFAAIREQVAPWIPEERVLVGAAAPIADDHRNPARIEALETFIRTHIAAGCPDEE